MQSTPLITPPRRIAKFLLILAAIPGLALAADSAGIRFSSPSIGWVLAADGSQLIEIAGIDSSPRTGRAVALPSAARRSWSSPDASSALLRLNTGLILLKSDGHPTQIVEIASNVDVAAAWDRSSTGFVACWAGTCQARAADGAIRDQWPVPEGSRIVAFSLEAGLLTATSESADWRQGAESIQLETVPAAAAFRPGTQELWLLDADGRLAGRDRQGRRTGEGELVANAVGLVSSADGKALFAVDPEGRAAVFTIESAQSERFSIDESVEGVWPAPGRFAIRLHESAKKPIAIWNGETGVTGWMPAATNEVRQ